MTQYTDRVEKQRTKQAAEKWGKRVKYIHANKIKDKPRICNSDSAEK